MFDLGTPKGNKERDRENLYFAKKFSIICICAKFVVPLCPKTKSLLTCESYKLSAMTIETLLLIKRQTYILTKYQTYGKEKKSLHLWQW